MKDVMKNSPPLFFLHFDPFRLERFDGFFFSSARPITVGPVCLPVCVCVVNVLLLSLFCLCVCVCLFVRPTPVLIRLNNLDLGKQSRGDNKKISEYFKGHPPSSPGRQSGTKSPSPTVQQQPIQPQSFLGVPSPCPSPQGAATSPATSVATASSYTNSNMNHSAPAGAFSAFLLSSPLIDPMTLFS